MASSRRLVEEMICTCPSRKLLARVAITKYTVDDNEKIFRAAFKRRGRKSYSLHYCIITLVYISKGEHSAASRRELSSQNEDSLPLPYRFPRESREIVLRILKHFRSRAVTELFHIHNRARDRLLEQSESTSDLRMLVGRGETVDSFRCSRIAKPGRDTIAIRVSTGTRALMNSQSALVMVISILNH